MSVASWKVDGVTFTLKPSIASGKPPWLLWREWRDDRGFPEMKIEWFDSPDAAFDKYPGARVQATLGI